MNATVYFVSTIGLVSSIFTTTINCLLIRRVTKTEKNADMTLFFYRFVMDVLMGSLCKLDEISSLKLNAFSVGVYLGLTVLYLVYPEHLEWIRSHVALIALPSSNAAAARAVVALSITIERNWAMYFPIGFHRFRRNFSLLYIFVAALLFGLFEDVVLFWICNFSSYVLPPNCVAFGCAVNACFRNYWVSWKNVVFFLTLVFSLLLCAKLMYWNCFSKKSPFTRVSRINRLALIDAGTVLFFDFLPSFLANLYPDSKMFSFEYVGPHNAVCKLFGSAVDAVLAYQIVCKKVETPRDESTSMRSKNKVTSASGTIL